MTFKDFTIERADSAIGDNYWRRGGAGGRTAPELRHKVSHWGVGRRQWGTEVLSPESVLSREVLKVRRLDPRDILLGVTVLSDATYDAQYGCDCVEEQPFDWYFNA